MKTDLINFLFSNFFVYFAFFPENYISAWLLEERWPKLGHKTGTYNWDIKQIMMGGACHIKQQIYVNIL